ncbi:MAG: CoA transferase [Proteobacteria bacterium]|nr:CoA transferase [Pseudomonadota bacterium]
MAQPLDGIRVIDFTTLLPGPLATLILAEAGAQVTKIERPGGEDMRRYAPRFSDSGAAFAMLNRGKASLVVDLKDTAALAPLLERIAKADVLVEQFRPGVMRRLGLDHATLTAINPRLVYCSISGYGQTGRRRAEAGHDLNYIGAAGLLSLQPGPLDRPVVPPALVADIGGGAFAPVINILLALRQRDASGRGAYLDIAMSEGVFTFAWLALATGFAAGRFPRAGEMLLTGGSPRYNLYPTSDGRLVACAALEQKFWAAFCDVIALEPGLRADGADRQAAIAAVAAIIVRQPADYWRARFAAADCCATIVASIEEAVRDPHFAERGLWDHYIAGAQGARMPALPVPVAHNFREPAGTAKAAPALDDASAMRNG